MVAYQIEDIRTFTQKLFLGEEFDRFLVKEVNITTYNNFTIDGHVRKGFYSREEQEVLGVGEFSSWKTLRPVCFFLIKGKRLPGSFRIDLQASGDETEAFLKECQAGGISREQIKGLYLQIRYEEGKLACITGTSLAAFTMDRTMEREWDGYAGQLLAQMGIAAAH